MKDSGVVTWTLIHTLTHLNICFQYHNRLNYTLLLVITILDFIIGTSMTYWGKYINIFWPKYFLKWFSSIIPQLEKRFNKAFNTSPVELISKRNVHFLLINSMAMEMDGCFLCYTSELKLRQISSKFNKIRLLFYFTLLDFFPLYFRPVKM